MQNTKLLLLLLFLVTTSSSLIAQDDIPEEISIKTEGISIGLLGGSQWPVGLSFDHMLTKRIGFELGAGLIAGGGGIRYFLTDPTLRRFNYFIEPTYMYNFEANNPMYSLPFGISYQTKKDFQYSFQAGIISSESIDPNPSPWIGLKLGYRFGQSILFEGRSETGSPQDLEKRTLFHFLLVLLLLRLASYMNMSSIITLGLKRVLG